MTEGDPERVRRVFDLICQRAELRGLRVLDLACRTGAFSTARLVTRRFAIVDTHTGADTDTVTVAGRGYRGQLYSEPDGAWSAIGNTASWWFTEASLHDAIRTAGWTAIEPVTGPGWPGEAADRRWLVIS